MVQIEQLVRGINQALVPQYEKLLREALAGFDKEWLIEQIVRLTIDTHSLREKDRQSDLEKKALRRAQRLLRIKALKLNTQKLKEFIHCYRNYDRNQLVKEGYYRNQPPAKGSREILADDLSPKGQALLEKSKDILFAILFGDTEGDTDFERNHRALLSMTVPLFKADALNFMQAVTEIGAEGTWRDPQNIANDQEANNILLQVEYGEAKDDLLGHGIIQTLGLINQLQMNEQVLYARMIKVEESTLIS